MVGMMELFWLFFLFLPTHPAGTPAPVAKVLKYVPPEAEFVLAADVASLGRGMNQGVDELLATKFMKSSQALKQASQMITAGRDQFVAQAGEFGLHPFKDIRYATLSVGGLQAPQPKMLVAAGGKISDKTLQAIAVKAGAKQDGALWIFPEDGGQFVMARAKDSTVLAGTRDWVELALAGKARCPAMKPLLSRYDGKTFLLMAFRSTEQMRAEWDKDADWIARPLLASMQGLALQMTYSGWSIKVQTDKQGVAVWRDLLYGLGRFAAAAREASDGFLFIGKGLLASLAPVAELKHDLGPEQVEVLEAFVANRDELHKLMTKRFVGPAPKTKVMTNRRQASVTLTVTGRTAALTLIPFVGGAGAWLLMGSAEPEPAMAPAAPAPALAPEKPTPAPTR